MDKKKEEKIILGKICFPHGILGWLKIFSFTEKKESIFKYKKLNINIKNSICILKIQKWKYQNKYFLIKIKNINNRNEALLLKNKKIFIYSKQLKKRKNEYFWHEILNCKIFDQNKNFLGIVKKILRTQSNDVLVINNNIKKIKKKREILIPFIQKKIIKEINLKKKIIFIKWKK
ncbi:MAG: ribosome maturation factor RimM [Buchnera aphidicola (Periphyllus lyropictus)]|uniref:ribosome maturation factor RimM n=1 Tax=Buchnera aphidicola TaxID=9 RepID=UPI001ECDDECB|nr:ribosome maturation factor RimM [Buchnera aphidicola]NIH16559.1 ribosome maturation factor RimM [Buchnera aphidicola (Periphyllus lyropictus)]USS94452.1 ribosome maturation factor RimM [Buchnera aphidicola (Periphyllus lyropictus)]